MGLALLLALVWGGPARSQQADAPAGEGPSPPPPPSAAADPAQDILIEGIGFAKLILELQLPAELERPRLQRLGRVLEKNLCWSGVFNLWRAAHDFCRLDDEPGRVDMRLEGTVREERLVLRLRDTGPEGLVLHEEALPLEPALDETVVMAAVNRLTERITGTPGLLGSTIAFVLRQPRYAKVIVATTTHGERVELLSHNRDISLLPKWSPQGERLVFTRLSNDGTRVFLRDLTGNGEHRFITPPGGLNSGGAFSPDGQRVAVTMSVDQNTDLYAVTLGTGRRQRLTSRTGIETQADWHPEGDRIVFVSDRTGGPQIYVLNLNTGRELRLTFDSGYNADPKWSPDGRSILFTTRVNRRDQIYIMDQYGQNVRAVTRGRYDAEQAEWSPDGRQIAFTSNRSGDFKIYVVSADGSALRRLTNTRPGFEETSPAWTARRLLPQAP